jgi:hypothetical protein
MGNGWDWWGYDISNYATRFGDIKCGHANGVNRLTGNDNPQRTGSPENVNSISCRWHPCTWDAAKVLKVMRYIVPEETEARTFLYLQT